MKKRLLAFLLAVVMVIGMIPTIAAKDISVMSILPGTTGRATYTFYVGEDVVDTQIVKAGDTLNEPAAPNGAGKFLGWVYEDGSDVTFGTVASVAEKEVKVIAKFDNVQYLLFMDKQENGRVVGCKTIPEKGSVTTSDVTFPVEATQAVTGWEDADGNAVETVTYGEEIYVLYAVVETGSWLTFNTKGGSYIAPQFFTTAPIEPATEPSKPGYTFGGWYRDADCTERADFSSITSSTTVYAGWIAKNAVSYTVLHMLENADDDDYSTDKNIETKTGAAGDLTAAAAKSYSGFTAQPITQQTIAGDGSTIVSVCYKRNLYTVKFYNDRYGRDEDTSKRITAKYGAKISDKWPGGSWFVNKAPDLDKTAQGNIDTMPLGGQSFYGQQSGTNAKAEYYLEVLPGETGTVVGGKTYKLHHTDSAPSGVMVSKEDRYPITGFTCNTRLSAKDGDRYNGAKFYYERNSYDLIFISGGQMVKTETVKFGADISQKSYTPTTPPEGKEGYVFVGWYDNEQGAGDVYVFTGKTMPAQNITLYARWVAPIHTVRFWQDTTKLDEITGIAHGSKITEDQAPKGRVHVGTDDEFYGWTFADGTPFNFDTEIRGNYDLYAKVGSKAGYTLIYSVDDDETLVVDSNRYAKNTDAVVKNYESADKVFLGWATSAESTTVAYRPGATIEMTANTTLYAVFGDKTGTVRLTYHNNFGTTDETYSEEDIANNGLVTVKSYAETQLPARTGYSFAGWNTKADGSGDDYAAGASAVIDNVDSNDLYAVWQIKSYNYTVEYYIDGTKDDTLTATLSAEYEAEITTYPNKCPTGYKLDTTENLPLTISAVAADNVIKVYYVKDSYGYSVEYYIDGTKNDSMTVTDSADFGTVINSYPVKCPTGYKRDKTENFPLTIGTDASANVIKVYYVKDDSQTQDTKYTVKYTIEGVEQAADKIEETGTAWINDNPAMIEIAEGGIPTPANKYTGYKLDPSNPTYPEAGTLVESGSEYTVNYVKDDSQTQNTNYTVKYTIEGVEQTNDKIEVKGTAWINDNPAKIAIAAGGIPTPADKYTGYKLDPSNPTYPEAGTLVESGSEYTVNYVKDDSQTQDTKYTVKYTIEGAEQTNDKVEVTGTAWINDNPAKIAIAAGGIPTPANKYTGYKLDPNNPAYPAAGTLVNSGTVFVVNYIKKENPTPATFDPDDIDGDGTVLAKKELIVLRGSAPEETFEVAIKDRVTGATMLTGEATFSGRGGQKAFYFGRTLEFYYAGTYTYTISETEGNTRWMTYDDSVYELEIVVKLDEEQNKLYVDSVNLYGWSNPSIVFTNTYDRKTGTVVIPTTPSQLNTDDHYAYVIGYPDGSVHPNGEITRAEVATIFFRLLRDDVRRANFTSYNTYTDVSTDKWYNNPVSTMSRLGIIKGYPDGTFRPNDPITRAEFAAIAARFDEHKAAKLASFTDIYGHWAINEISLAYENGWIKGYNDGTFRPNRNITRAEAMALINRVLNRAPEKPSDLLNDMNKWTDNMDTTKWYYLDVQEATNSHDYTRKTNNYELWKKMLADPDWAKYER